ncbi:hypothetical protein JOB18_012812 [Solea senegalensis]|uniref:Uncharacterized protein n=1 Tax=Solea senegalensis TaxID=28829 RepID=A0AAV6PM70_SOLSE|nr:hypothetical protein JOB18_012812 [Solea senegalensis]
MKQLRADEALISCSDATLTPGWMDGGGGGGEKVKGGFSSLFSKDGNSIINISRKEKTILPLFSSKKTRVEPWLEQNIFLHGGHMFSLISLSHTKAHRENQRFELTADSSCWSTAASCGHFVSLRGPQWTL